MEISQNKTDRKVTNDKDIVFDTYVRVLMFMIENKGKSFMNSDIKHSLFGDTTDTSIKNMLKKIVDFYVESEIFKKVTEITDVNGKIVELKPNQNRVRLYDIDLDDNGEDYGVRIHIPQSRDGRIKLCETVASMVTSIKDAVIYTSSIQTVLESQLFGFNTDFVSQTISKSILRQQNINNQYNETIGMYPIDIIMSIIKSQINVNVTFENFGNTIQLNNTKIKRISIKENGFDIHFDNFISQNQSDLNQIKLIENSSEDGLRGDVDKLKELSETIDDETIKEVIIKITTFEEGVDVFEF